MTPGHEDGLSEIRASAVSYIRAGFYPFPLSPNSKKPLPGSNGFKDAAKTEEAAKALFKHHKGNIGITFPPDLFALDIDLSKVRDGKNLASGFDSLALLELVNGELPPTLTQKTASGGEHRVFRLPSGVTVTNSAGKLGEGLDIRTAGGYIVAEPSTFDGRAYGWQDYVPAIDDAPDIADAPKWLIDLLQRPAPKEAPHYAQDDLIEDMPDERAWADLRGALAFLPSDDRDDWVKIGQALKRTGGQGFALWIEWSKKSPKYNENDALHKWDGFTGERTSYKAVFAEAQRRGWINPAKGGAPADWPDPLPIPSGLLPVETFNDALLPFALREWVADIAHRMQCPPDFTAVGAMVALSSVIGRKAGIRPKRKDDWLVIPNLWGVVVGRPGVMKSPALSEVMKPLDRLSLAANEQHQAAMRDYAVAEKFGEIADKDAEQKARKAIKAGNTAVAEQLLRDAASDEADTPPPLRRYKVTDASVEALGEILIENPWGTLAYRDELNGLLRSLDKEGQEGARAFYLQGYDGNQGYTFDRIMRGRNLHIPAVCIAMLGGIQPGKLKAYIHDAVSGGAGDDGLLQRFGLLVWPDVGSEWVNVDRWPDTPAKATAFEAFQRLDDMLPGTDGETGEPAPVVYRFTEEAQATFEEWRQEFETAMRSGEHHPAMESHLSKYRKLVPALALVIALADGEQDVSQASLVRALGWAEYLQSHAKRAYAAGTRPVTDGAAALLKKIRSGAVADAFKARDVYHKDWAYLSTPEQVKAAAAMLCDLDHLKYTEQGTGQNGGRPTAIYLINPKTLGSA